MSERRSDDIRADNARSWDAMQAHRFVTAIERDALSLDLFKAYLIYECEFVETAMLIFSHTLIKAPGLDERRWLAGVLQALAVDQIGYFDDAFSALNITLANRTQPLPHAVVAFATVCSRWRGTADTSMVWQS